MEKYAMKIWRTLLPAMAALLFVGQAAAQTEESAEQRRTVEVREVEVRRIKEREKEVERQMYDAERRMAEAARQIAELTAERLPQLEGYLRRFEIMNSGRPRLGITIGGDADGPVEGVAILGVTPGSAADDAGLRAGDVITSVNGESLSAEGTDESTSRLLDFMRGVEMGDTLDLEYLRAGKVGNVEVEPKPVEAPVFAFRGHDPNFDFSTLPNVHIAPGIIGAPHEFAFHWTNHGWGDMELVELNEGLGRYFGTDNGLLVVSAPESSALQLKDGDVIQKIDGRTPSSVRHALRILSSYQAGESLKLEIMRDKKRRTLDVAIPDDRQSMLSPPELAPVVRPTRVPTAPRPSAPVEKT
jgi:C-terminal processing protease CtpA/Prc